MEITEYLKQCQKRVNLTLKKRLPSVNKEPQKLHEAMNYAVLNGGKRLRSALIYASGKALNAKFTILNEICAAVEMIHAFSLIHDDLPALDNDDLRRGKPTCHKVFGEATAILAGDALQTLAFEILTKLDKKVIKAEVELQIIQLISQAIGSRGMAGGEELDLEMEGKKTSVRKLENMYQLKTGRLLSASVLLGALAASCQNKKILNNLGKFGECIGLAFQIHDDIVGIESSTKILGKTQNLDLEKSKPIYPVLVGMKEAKRKEQLLYQKALGYLDKTGINANHLKEIATFIIKRNY